MVKRAGPFFSVLGHLDLNHGDLRDLRDHHYYLCYWIYFACQEPSACYMCEHGKLAFPAAHFNKGPLAALGQA